MILLTGASGFVGSHVLQELIHAGHSVRCFIRKTSRISHLKGLPIDLVYGDLSDEVAIRKSLDNVTTVYHFAALVRAKNEEAYQRANVDGCTRLYRLFSDSSRAERFLFCSSLAAAGPSSGLPHTESSPLNPINAYGRSKRDAEKALHEIGGAPLTILRPPAVYGPGDRAILIYFQCANRGFTFYLGNPERRLSMIHVRDVAKAAVCAAQHPQGVGTYFISDGNSYSWKEIGQHFETAFHRKLRALTIPDGLLRTVCTLVDVSARPFGFTPVLNREKAMDLTAPGWVCSPQAAMKSWGFAPEFTLHTGIPQALQWYRDHGWL